MSLSFASIAAPQTLALDAVLPAAAASRGHETCDLSGHHPNNTGHGGTSLVELSGYPFSTYSSTTGFSRQRHWGAVRLIFSRSSTGWTKQGRQISSASPCALLCTALTTLHRWLACKVSSRCWRRHVHGIRGEPCVSAPAAWALAAVHWASNRHRTACDVWHSRSAIRGLVVCLAPHGC